MKALLLDQPGLPETLYVSDLPEPHPAAGEVRVRVHAAGLNPADYKFAGRGFPRWQYPHILGLDVAGVIDALGADVTQWQVGDAVYYHGDLSKPEGLRSGRSPLPTRSPLCPWAFPLTKPLPCPVQALPLTNASITSCTLKRDKRFWCRQGRVVSVVSQSN